MWECGELSEEGRLYAGLQVTAWLTTKSKCSEVRVKVSTILFCTYCIKCHRFPCMRKALVTRTQLWCLLHSPGYCWGARQARGLLSVPWCACPGSGGDVWPYEQWRAVVLCPFSALLSPKGWLRRLWQGASLSGMQGKKCLVGWCCGCELNSRAAKRREITHLCEQK